MANETQTSGDLVVDRRSGDRRIRAGRRTNENASTYTGDERRTISRRKVERRRQIDPTTCERDYTDDEIELMTAMDEYKRRSGRQFPTWSEVLEVVGNLGYRKVAEPTEILKKPRQ